MGKIKISYRKAEPFLNYHKPKRYPACKKCGCRLTDEKSIKRGYGHKCFASVVTIIVLEIKPDEDK